MLTKVRTCAIMITVPKGTRKETASMKVYLVWYRNTETHRTNIWGVYDTEEKAETAKQEAESLDFMVWINEEEVQ